MFVSTRLVVLVALISVGLYVTKKFCNGPPYSSDVKIDGKVVIVTGANTGIGKETALDLVKRGGKVYMACRSLSRAQDAVDDIIKQTGVSPENLPILQLDLSSLESVRNFAAEFRKRESELHILVNNAGVMMVPHQRTKDGFELTFGVNHLGHFLLTQLLANELLAATFSRVVTVSSHGHFLVDSIRFHDLNYEIEEEYGRFQSYCHSKLANVLFSKELARRLKGSGVTSYSLHPGAVHTDLFRNVPYIENPIVSSLLYYISWPFFKDTRMGAQTTIFCTVEPGLQDVTGTYYMDVKEKEASTAAQNETAARLLWNTSMDKVSLKDEDVHPRLRRSTL